MTRRATASSGRVDQHLIRQERMTASKLLNRLAASPWAISCASFVATALFIQSNSLKVF
jgi:hypothetical protein